MSLNISIAQLLGFMIWLLAYLLQYSVFERSKGSMLFKLSMYLGASGLELYVQNHLTFDSTYMKIVKRLSE